jgi:hypothetical protein
VDYFWALIDQLDPADYPPRVKPVPYNLGGTWGFSGGSGLVRKPGAPLPPFPFGGVMFVGSNLNSVAGWKKAEDRGDPGDPDDPKMTYWRNMRKLLELAEVDRTQVFFTNVFSIGLMEVDSATASFPGRKDPSFCSWCRAFLAEQMRVMEPRLVVALGADAQRELGVRRGQVIPPHPGVDYTLVGLQHTSSPTYYMRLSAGRLIDREAALLKQAAGGRPARRAEKADYLQ